MCGRYVSPERAAIERAWQVGRGNSNPFARRYNVLPASAIPILVAGTAHGLELAEARWGLIPSWWKQDKPASGEVKAYKQPHYIFRRDRRPLCFAGLMETSPAAQLTCAVLTRAAAASMAQFHERMPVVLPDELLVRWLRADVDQADAPELIAPA